MKPVDTATKFDPQTNNHVVFIRKNKFYVVELENEGQQLSTAELERFVQFNLPVLSLFPFFFLSPATLLSPCGKPTFGAVSDLPVISSVCYSMHRVLTHPIFPAFSIHISSPSADLPYSRHCHPRDNVDLTLHWYCVAPGLGPAPCPPDLSRTWIQHQHLCSTSKSSVDHAITNLLQSNRLHHR